jgi:hypothetical protein
MNISSTKIISCILAITIWWSSSESAIAGKLSDRLQQFPNWSNSPKIARAGGELIYPQWFEGRWLATSTLVEQIAPLAPKLVTPGFESNRQYLDRPIEFEVRFIPAQPTNLTTRSPISIPRLKSNSPETNIVADRAFNGLNIARAYLGDANVKSVKIDPQNPTRQITQLDRQRQLVSIATGFDRELPTPNNFIATELSQQLFSGSPNLYLNTVEVTTDYQFSPSLTPRITATQIAAIYLSPQDPDYFRAIDRPVALYRYRLDLVRLS